MSAPSLMYAERLMSSKPYTTGEEMTVGDIASMFQIDRHKVANFLQPMVRDGKLEREVRSRGDQGGKGNRISYYRRPTPKLLQVDWRHDKDVYHLIEEELRGW